MVWCLKNLLLNYGIILGNLHNGLLFLNLFFSHDGDQFIILTDFNQWLLNMGIRIDNQHKSLDPQIMVLERLYDLIIDTRNNAKE